MNYYSTNCRTSDVTLEEAVVKGLAADKGLFMPRAISLLPAKFFREIEKLSLQEIAFEVATAFFGEDLPSDILRSMVDDTLNFDIPLVKVTDRIYSLELFHGPTLAFKDVGARFMARMLGYFIRKEGKQGVHVLVASVWKGFVCTCFIPRERSVGFRNSSSLRWEGTLPLSR